MIQSDQNIHQNAPNCTVFSKFSRVAYAPDSLSCANKLQLFIYENSHFSLKILSKYTPKRTNCNMFSNISS